MLSRPATYAKAIVSALITVLGVLYVLLDDGEMTAADGVKLAIAVVTAFGAVFAIPNAPTPPNPNPPQPGV